VIFTFSNLFSTESATLSGTPLDGHETLEGYALIDYSWDVRPTATALARQVGGRIRDPLENSMALFKFPSPVLPEGTTLFLARGSALPTAQAVSVGTSSTTPSS
jgi:hypothetical protein